jgi:HAD superfamily hydrolase (TIGR01458 family)
MESRASQNRASQSNRLPGSLQGIRGLLLDMDGVLTVSWRPVPGAVEAVRRVRGAGLPLLILTSTTSRSRAEVAAGLRDAGFPVDDNEVQTAAIAAAAYLRTYHPRARVFLLGDARPEDLQGVRVVGADDEPHVILVSGADPSFHFENLNRVLRALLRGALLVAMHRGLFWMTQQGECLDAGAYVLGLEKATGRPAIITGKPAPGVFAAALADLGLPSSQVAMVGDDINNDVLAAQATGIRGVLVRTGKFREDTLAAAPGTPDYLIDSIADMPALLGL